MRGHLGGRNMHVTTGHWLELDPKPLGSDPLVGKVDALGERLGEVFRALLERLTQQRSRPKGSARTTNAKRNNA